MSIPLPNVDLSTAIVGSSGVLPLQNVGIGAGGVTSDPSTVNKQANIWIFNDSGCGLTITFKQGGGGFKLPAGAWTYVPLSPGEYELDWSVDYILANAPVTLLMSTYYAPGESLPQAFTLGNSPIGGAVAGVNIAQQLINTANAPVVTVIEIKPTGAQGDVFSLSNTGQLIYQRENANGSMTPIIQGYPGSPYPGSPSELILGNDSTHAVEVQGNLIVDSGNSVTFSSPLYMEQGQYISGIGAYDLIFNYPSGQNLQIQQNAVQRAYFNTAGSLVENVAFISSLFAGIAGNDLVINAPGGQRVQLQAGGTLAAGFWQQGTVLNKLYNGGAMSGMTTGTVSLGASGSAAVSHGLSATPTCVLMVTDQASSSGTCSAYSYTSTQFTAFNGAAATLVYRWFAWC